MANRNLHPQPLYRLPFTPERFYAFPYAWLADVQQTADLDTRHLLLYHVDYPEHRIVFPDEQNESFWTRHNDLGLPEIVSDEAYRQHLKDLLARKLLVASGERSQYLLPDWPPAGDAGGCCVPRAFIANRWPRWLGQKNWDSRAALLGLLHLLYHRHAGTGLVGPRDALEVSAATPDIRRVAVDLLPALRAPYELARGLRWLEKLGLVVEKREQRTNRERVFSLRVGSFDHTPDYPLADIARACDLDPETGRPWLELIRAFLTYNCELGQHARPVWLQIQRARPWVATAEDAAELLRRLKERAAAGSSTSVARVLGDFVASQTGPQGWTPGKPFTIPFAPGNNRLPPGALPTPLGRTSPQGILLSIRYHRGRLSPEEAAQLVTGAQFLARFQAADDEERLVSLDAPLHPDAAAVRLGQRIDCSVLHRKRRYRRPFSLALETPRQSVQITLECRFWVRYRIRSR